MADFLDFDSLEMNVDEQVNGAKEHPLKGMKTGAKMAYVGGLLFACHADDNTLQKEERSHVMGVAHSLGVGKEEVDELAEMVVGLADKIAYLKEIVATLKDRKTILFFLCDMIKAMGADGEINGNAQKLIEAVEKLAHLKGADIDIVSGYQKILVKDGAAADDVELGNTTKAGVEKVLRDWFAPVVKGAQTSKKGARKSRKKNVDAEASVMANDIAATSSNTVAGTDGKAQQNQASTDELQNVLKDAQMSLLDTQVRMAFTDLMFENYSWIWYLDSVPERKKYNAHISMMVKEDEHIVQIDTTLFGSGKEGLVITNRALYYKNSFEVPHRIGWHDLKECSICGNDIDFGEHGSFFCNVGNSEARDKFFGMLSTLVHNLQAK